MPNIEKHAAGEFSWVELSTTDQAAEKKFYGQLFGWTANDAPMGPNNFYTMFEIQRKPVAAAYTLPEDQKAGGVPPHWMLYIAVENADATANRTAELGGKVMAPAFDVFEFGRMAVLQDPTGAVFSVWQAKKHTGTQMTGVDGTLCWADLNTPSQDRAGQFYSQLFGWKIEKGDEDTHNYQHIKNGEQFIGGIPPESVQSSTNPPHWLPYFAVSDCDATAGKAAQLGGKLYMRPTTFENVGRIAVIADPQGAVFAIFQPARDRLRDKLGTV